jgi:hypothetical protein
MNFVKHTLAAIALVCAGAAQAGSVVMPGGNLGDLNIFPAQFGDSATQDGFTPFAATYHFSLSVLSDVYGSAAALDAFFGQTLSPIMLIGASIDGIDLLAQPSASPASGLTFSLGHLAAGDHTLTIAGVAMPGATAFTGSVYAQVVTQVPEPASLAFALAGVAVVGGLRARRGTAGAKA